MKMAIVPVSPFHQNCSVLVCEKTQRAALIDPGWDADRIKQMVLELDVQVEKIFLTHAHIDHCGMAKILAEFYKVEIEGPHQADQFWLDALPEQSKRFGFDPVNTFLPDRWLNDQDEVRFGEESLKVLHCPGHTPGHVVFFSQAHQYAWVGDVLFKGSIGRTDFPLGNHQQLITSIRTQLWPLGGQVQFVPGHGPMSSFEAERQTNPYVADDRV